MSDIISKHEKLLTNQLLNHKHSVMEAIDSSLKDLRIDYDTELPTKQSQIRHYLINMTCEILDRMTVEALQAGYRLAVDDDIRTGVAYRLASQPQEKDHE